MWTEQETKRYEEHLEKHWMRNGEKIKYNPLCEQYQAQIKAMEHSQWQRSVELPRLTQPHSTADFY